MTKKYRPYFSLGELSYIHTLLHEKEGKENNKLLQYVERFIEDCQRGDKKADYLIVPRKTIENKLGFDRIGVAKDHLSAQGGIDLITKAFKAGELSHEEEDEYCKNVLKINPNTGEPLV